MHFLHKLFAISPFLLIFARLLYYNDTNFYHETLASCDDIYAYLCASLCTEGAVFLF